MVFLPAKCSESPGYFFQEKRWFDFLDLSNKNWLVFRTWIASQRTQRVGREDGEKTDVLLGSATKNPPSHVTD